MTGPRGPAGFGLARLGIDRATFYRQARAFHGYLSAFAFLMLMLFSLTGITLNHPDWFRDARGAASEREVRLDPAALRRAAAADRPLETLAGLVGAAAPLRGGFKSGEILGEEARLRFEGVSGHSDVVVDLGTGIAEIGVARAGLVGTLNDLHRGKNAGPVWSAVIDATAILVLLLSLLGYVIFFSLRFRLRTSLALTAGSVVLIAAVFVFAVP